MMQQFCSRIDNLQDSTKLLNDNLAAAVTRLDALEQLFNNETSVALRNDYLRLDGVLQREITNFNQMSSNVQAIQSTSAQLQSTVAQLVHDQGGLRTQKNVLRTKVETLFARVGNVERSTLPLVRAYEYGEPPGLQRNEIPPPAPRGRGKGQYRGAARSGRGGGRGSAPINHGNSTAWGAPPPGMYPQAPAPARAPAPVPAPPARSDSPRAAAPAPAVNPDPGGRLSDLFAAQLNNAR